MSHLTGPRSTAIQVASTSARRRATRANVRPVDIACEPRSLSLLSRLTIPLTLSFTTPVIRCESGGGAGAPARCPSERFRHESQKPRPLTRRLSVRRGDRRRSLRHERSRRSMASPSADAPRTRDHEPRLTRASAGDAVWRAIRRPRSTDPVDLAADPDEGTRLRSDLAPARAQTRRDQRRPERHRLAATGNHPDLLI